MTENTNKTQDMNHLHEQLAVARREISNLRQQIKSLGHIHQKECDSLRQIVTDWKCNDCRLKVNEPPEPATEAIESISDDITLKTIGVISTQFPEKRGTPRQPGISADSIAKLTIKNDILTNPNHALEGLEEFSHMWIIFYFHKNDSTHIRAKVAPPRLNGLRTGVFASRSPHRPSPIGLSLVKIESIENNIIYFSGVDMIHETPVIDIKPYIPLYDSPCHNPSWTQSPSSSTSRRLDGRETNYDSLPQFDGDGSVTDTSPRLERLTIRPESRMGEREAPDGEEDVEFSGVSGGASGLLQQSIPENPDIRVPNWINEPPVQQLRVVFNERALSQLQTIKNQEAEQTKTVICNVLREDPRSVYLRTRWSNQFYTFRICELHVSCKFDDNNHSVSVFQIRDVEALSNE
ncbi:tRNA (adenine(37)-N6)-methyltransferase [Chrysoperla carnea]|uniref:tRNA (adenine(37)-N6)-methyltransferase n=1 Tax=Chrysoperla carnea TaxID=189513 RepID=UPI001D078124|nr:tRNA (adenine(37)-N6)-methyltransferase [Chrysoperla carnea]